MVEDGWNKRGLHWKRRRGGETPDQAIENGVADPEGSFNELLIGADEAGGRI